MTQVRDFCIPDDLAQEISREAEAQGVSWSAVAVTLLTEALKIRRIPGIIMRDGPTGRRAAIAGSGLDVWEIIATWRVCGEHDEELAQHYPWVAPPQLQAALAYYRLYPDEIDVRLQREQQWTAARIKCEVPFAVLPYSP